MAGERGERRGLWFGRDLYRLRHTHEREFTGLELEGRAELEARMDRYFANRLDMFPFVEQASLPNWFHLFYEETIEDRFPDDQDLRDLIRRYRERFTFSIWRYVVLKRLYAAAAMAAISLAVFAAPWFRVTLNNPLVAAPLALVWIGVAVALYAGLSSLSFRLYKQAVSIESANLSRVIVQRTTDLQRIFLALRAKVDLDETQYGDDGELWGEESARLMRLLMWVAKRAEYIEKFIQTEMWRVRRQRYWAGVGGIVLTAALIVAMAAFVILTPTPTALRGPELAFVPLGSLGLKLVVIAGFSVLAWCSYRFWRTPLDLARAQLTPESWIRFGDLALDDVIGEQVRRDKTRLVEYRTLNRGLGAPAHHRR